MWLDAFICRFFFWCVYASHARHLAGVCVVRNITPKIKCRGGRLLPPTHPDPPPTTPGMHCFFSLRSVTTLHHWPAPLCCIQFSLVRFPGLSCACFCCALGHTRSLPRSLRSSIDMCTISISPIHRRSAVGAVANFTSANFPCPLHLPRVSSPLN